MPVLYTADALEIGRDFVGGYTRVFDYRRGLFSEDRENVCGHRLMP